VLKISPHRIDRSYVREAYQLNVLRAIGLPAPQVYACRLGSLDEPYSYLLMEFMAGISLNEAKQKCDTGQFDHLQSHLADLLLTIHSNTASRYMRVTEGRREEFASWPQFYRHVYDDIWQEIRESPELPARLRKGIARVHEKLDTLLAHDDCPRLVHSDIWSANILARPDEQGRWWVSAILDPNCKYAHIEAELAYMELFNTITPTFMRSYQVTRPLPPEYHSIRKPVYQLYEMINHVRTFGQKYLEPLDAAMKKVAKVA